MVIVLASASPRRSFLLEERGILFRVAPPPGVDESAVTGEAIAVARELARMKAEAGLGALDPAGRTSEVLVIGADTVVEIDGEILGKPGDRADAAAMLRKLSGRVHRVTTGVAIARPGAPTRVESETSEVRFHPLDDGEIEAYLDTGDAEGKAGAYGIQSEGRRLVAGFRGCYYNIVGLPVKRLIAMLRDAGASLPGIDGDCDCARHPLLLDGAGCR
jgi:septum formation protein